jgi:RAMP superfamily
MTTNHLLKLDINSYWHPGTGKGSGSHVDAVVEKDRFGCPFISGRMLKGLVRDAVYRGAHWDIYRLENMPPPNDLVEVLFGSTAFVDMRPRNETIPGLIRFEDAVLEKSVREWLGLPSSKKYRSALYRDIYTTAISSKSGAAKPRSLRGQEVAVPLVLTSVMEISTPSIHTGHTGDVTQWVFSNAGQIVEKALPLIRSVGSNRTRGLGRVRISFKEVTE